MSTNFRWGWWNDYDKAWKVGMGTIKAPWVRQDSTVVERNRRITPFAELIVSHQANIFGCIEAWISARPDCTLTFSRGEGNKFWVVKAYYKKAYLMVPSSTLIDGVIEATSRIERISDGH